MNITFITDPLLTTAGATRPPALLASELQKRGHDVTLVSLSVSDEVKNSAKAKQIRVESLGSKFNMKFSVPIVESWAKSLFKSKMVLPNNSNDNEVLINTSSCFKVKSHLYYAQGPITKALDDMVTGMPCRYKVVYRLSAPVLRYLEKRTVKDYAELSDLVIANSKFCASMYEELGVKVNDVINPPLDCDLFMPATSEPSEDYILTYFGIYNKETKFSVIKQIADAGVLVKAFGCKAAGIPQCIAKHPNVQFLGSVSNKELVYLYSNALYVLFTFAHEPFGYIPVESMACGTPVLTYNTQGPRESVVDGTTGWLAESDKEIVELASKIWKGGYSKKMRKECIDRASLFDVKLISEQWVKLFQQLLK